VSLSPPSKICAIKLSTLNLDAIASSSGEAPEKIVVSKTDEISKNEVLKTFQLKL
jgi:hypothetical protein